MQDVTQGGTGGLHGHGCWPFLACGLLLVASIFSRHIFVLFYILKHTLKFNINHCHRPEAEKQHRAHGVSCVHVDLIIGGALTK